MGLKAGTDICTDSGVTGFVAAPDGTVIGVATRKGRPRVAHRRAGLGVLVNVGGFAYNQEMRDRYQPGTSIKSTGTTPGDTGEMIRAMMDLGAAVAQMDEMVGNRFSIPPRRENQGDGVSLGAVSGQMDIAKPHSIVVDRSGVRYMNEAGSYMAFCRNMLERDKSVPAVPSDWIVDARYMKSFMLAGTFAGSKKPRDWYEADYVKRADTIEEWNAGVRAGRDSLFGRGERAYGRFIGDTVASQTLGTIEQGPFYAMPVVPGDVGTYGGVATDAQARMLREDGSAIPGLYATVSLRRR